MKFSRLPPDQKVETTFRATMEEQGIPWKLREITILVMRRVARYQTTSFGIVWKSRIINPLLPGNKQKPNYTTASVPDTINHRADHTLGSAQQVK